MICDLCSSAHKDEKALQAHNNKHHKKKATKPTPAPKPALAEAEVLKEEAEVPSADDTATPATDASTASEANIRSARQGFTCGNCNIFSLTRASFKI